MKLRRLHHVRKSSLTSLLILTLFVNVLGVFFPIHLARTTDGTVVHVEPPTSVANPYQFYSDNNFTIRVNVTDVSGLFGYEIRLEFDDTVLELYGPVQEGEFLKRTDSTASPPTSFSWALMQNQTVAERSYILVVGSINPDPFGFPDPWDPHGEDGSGTLFKAKFRVIAPGESELKLYRTKLWDPDGPEVGPIDHSLSSGDFHTEVPVASFFYTPNSTVSYGRPIVGENITFDASSSYDPENPEGGGIDSYTWDFNDTTLPVTEYDPIAYHIYENVSTPLNPYNVKLTVIDDDGNTTTYSIKESQNRVHVYFHDISILEITAPDEVHTREVATINVTVLNNGSHSEYFNVTTYCNSNPIDTLTVGPYGLPPLQAGTNDTYTFDLNTFIDRTTLFSNTTFGSGWNDPLNGFTNDTLYTSSNTSQASQVYLSYLKDVSTGEDLDWTGWKGLSKVEIGVKAHTDTGGDDNLTIQVAPLGVTYRAEHNFTIKSTTDKFFWIDVTHDTASWDLSQFRNGLVKIRMKYIQVGDNATHIYVDLVQLRITPSNPTNLIVGTYAIGATVFLVEPDLGAHYLRSGQGDDLNDNTLFRLMKVTEIPYRDIAVESVTVSPTDVAVGATSTVKVKVKNHGNVEETFDIFLYVNSTTPVANQTGLKLRAGASKTYSFSWFIAANTTVEGTYNITISIPPLLESQTSNCSAMPDEKWTYPLNATASDNLYTYCNTNNTFQDYTGFNFHPTGWPGVSKVEVGIEAYTDSGGDDQVNITVYSGKGWSESYIYSITQTTDTNETLWVDVTGDLLWSTSMLNNTKVRIQYIQVGGTATPIYVDWLPVRVSPLDPTNNTQSVTVLMRLLPVSFFTFSPSTLKIGDEVTFDASASYGPGYPGEDTEMRARIENYIWDFGDETTSEGVAIVKHTYNKAGAFKVKLTVVDDEGLNSTRTTSVKVEKLSSSITLLASPTTVPISLSTTISGAVLLEDETIQKNQDVTVSINYTRVDEIDWLTLANVSTNEDGEYSIVWSQQNGTWPQQNGTYTLKAFWRGDNVTLFAESSELNVTVIIRDTAILDVALSRIRLTAGKILTIDVTAANKGTATETLNVTIYQNGTLLKTETLANLAAGNSKLFSFDWNTTGMEEGVYIIKAVAEPLLGETYTTDNSRTNGVVIQELLVEEPEPLNIFLYTTIALIIAVAVLAVYIIRWIKFKPK